MAANTKRHGSVGRHQTPVENQRRIISKATGIIMDKRKNRTNNLGSLKEFTQVGTKEFQFTGQNIGPLST